MKNYVLTWIAILLLLTFEYWAITFHPSLSILLKIQALGIISSTVNLNTKTGRPLSLWLGYIGFGLMVIMNVYSMRKRYSFLQNYGSLKSWLNFHIFCGLVGPTMILFHCNLKVRGIVGISFWSMVVSFSSGVIGRYFYVQMLNFKSDYDNLSEQFLKKLEKTIETQKLNIPQETRARVIMNSLLFAGAQPNQASVNPISALYTSIMGDLRMVFSDFNVPRDWPISSKFYLINYAINKRKSQFLEPYQRLMGYWHAFHFPFAVFMYIAAVIHIISSLMFLNVR